MILQTFRKTRQGFTIIELMIALVIGSVIMLGIGTVYSSTKRSNRTMEEFSRLQENGRFALNYIARFVREAGYSGCASGNMRDDDGDNVNDAAINLLNPSTDGAWNFNTGLEGYEAAGTGPGETVAAVLDAYPTVSSTPANWTATTATTSVYADLADGSADAMIPGSDILIARSTDGNGVELTATNDAAWADLAYTGTDPNGCGSGNPSYSGLCTGDVVVLSDCANSVKFQISAVENNNVPTSVRIKHQQNTGSSPGNINPSSWGGNSPNFSHLDFEPGESELLKISTKYFYIGAGTNGPALFMKQADGDGQELVEGVENMQVLYGEDTNSDNIPDYYVPADQISVPAAPAIPFDNIVSVRITLLMRSVRPLAHRGNIPAADRTFVIGGNTAATGVTITAPDDQRMRKIMSMTIKLRNSGT